VSINYFALRNANILSTAQNNQTKYVHFVRHQLSLLLAAHHTINKQTNEQKDTLSSLKENGEKISA